MPRPEGLAEWFPCLANSTAESMAVAAAPVASPDPLTRPTTTFDNTSRRDWFGQCQANLNTPDNATPHDNCEQCGQLDPPNTSREFFRKARPNEETYRDQSWTNLRHQIVTGKAVSADSSITPEALKAVPNKYRNQHSTKPTPQYHQKTDRLSGDSFQDGHRSHGSSQGGATGFRCGSCE